MNSKERMFEAEMTHQQLQQVQEYLQKLDRQVSEVLAMKEALKQFETIGEDEELLVPLAAGVFMKARSTSDRMLQVNVGQGVVVPKTVPEVHQMLEEQLAEMRRYEQELQGQFDALLAKLQQIQKEFE
jgi:prefoldin alpha subunit